MAFAIYIENPYLKAKRRRIIMETQIFSPCKNIESSKNPLIETKILQDIIRILIIISSLLTQAQCIIFFQKILKLKKKDLLLLL
jgi:hypothetical protein